MVVSHSPMNVILELLEWSMTSPDLPDYSLWLGSALINDTLPWQHAITITMPTFLDLYSLHDSLMIGMWMLPNRTTIAILRWDTTWTNGRVDHPGIWVATWPLLCIRFHAVVAAAVELELEWIGTAQSGPFTTLERPYFHLDSVTSEDLHCTEFDDGSDDGAWVIHAPRVDLLCLSPTQDLIPIPVAPELSDAPVDS
jgi:hypothetical protein